MAKNLLRVIHVLEGLQWAEHLRMLNMYGLQSTKIGDWLAVWELEADLGIPKNSLSEILMQDLVRKHAVASLFHSSCYQSRRNNVVQLLTAWFEPLPKNRGALGLWLFPKLKSSFKGKRFQTIDEIQENMMGQLMAVPTKDQRILQSVLNSERDAGRTVWGPKMTTSKGTEFSLSCIPYKCLCFPYYMAGYFLDPDTKRQNFIYTGKGILFRHKIKKKSCHLQQHGWTLRHRAKHKKSEKDKYCIRLVICGN